MLATAVNTAVASAYNGHHWLPALTVSDGLRHIVSSRHRADWPVAEIARELLRVVAARDVVLVRREAACAIDTPGTEYTRDSVQRELAVSLDSPTAAAIALHEARTAR